MVDTGIFCTTAEVQRKAGANASATANVEAYINDFVTQAEYRYIHKARSNKSWFYKCPNKNGRKKYNLFSNKKSCSIISSSFSPIKKNNLILNKI